ncbi:hypothetical protein [Microcoleus sp. B3-D7]|uniref:hypothetical protein n=1 Tax=Microcoleus sp. B3-D7 TaxID=2818659 RepID=UPI002FD2FD6A
MENPIIINGFAFRIPNIPSRYRANCSREFGVFVTGETKGMNSSRVEKAGLARGNFVEMAVCAIGSRILTFEPNYVNEQFTEIWGIPVSGEMKTYFHEKCSELSTFLIHRQSQDKLKSLIETFSKQVFNTWVAEGMPGSYDEYARSKAAESYFNNIFRFELTPAESRAYGAYYYVGISVRPPNGALDEAALKAARQIMEAQSQGIVYCVDPRLVDNEQMCLGSAPVPEAQALPEASEPVEVASSSKQIKSVK